MIRLIRGGFFEIVTIELVSIGLGRSANIVLAFSGSLGTEKRIGKPRCELVLLIVRVI